MKILSGSYVDSEYEGDIYVNGKKVEFHSVKDAQDQGIEMVYQELNMMLDASVAENLFVGNLPNQLRDSGVSCIYISHKLDEVYRICDRVLVIRDGHTISCRPIDQVKQLTLIEEMVGRKVENLYPNKDNVNRMDVIH